MNIKQKLAAAGFLLAALAAPLSAQAAGTGAGTVIENTATLSFESDDPNNPGTPVTTSVPSTKNFAVDEVLDVTVAQLGGGVTTVVPGSTDKEVRWTVTNDGNGNEQYNLIFDVADPSDDFNPSNVTYWVTQASVNGGLPYQYTQGVTVLTLAPDETVTVAVRGDIPAGAASGDEAIVKLRALSNTVQVANGTGFQSANPGDVVGSGVSAPDTQNITHPYNVVVGTTRADQQGNGKYVVRDISANLDKNASAVHPTLGAGVYAPGSVITYTLTLRVSGDGTLDKVVIKDSVPTGTTYVNNSIKIGYAGDTTEAAAIATATAAAAAAPAQGQSIDGDMTNKINDEINVYPGGNDGNINSGTVTVGGAEPAAKAYVVTFQVTVN